MKNIHKTKTVGLLLLGGMLATGTSGAVTLLASDFAGTTESGPTLSNITWAAVGITAPASTLTVNNTILANGTGDLFTTGDADGVIAVANNTSNGGAWNVVTDFTTLAQGIDLEDFSLTYTHYNGGGTFQTVARDANYTVEIRDILGAALAGSSVTINTLDINTNPTAPGVGPQMITFDLSGVTLAANTDYSLFVQAARADGPGGNNTGVDDFSLTGTLVTIPEPSSTALLGLASLALIIRRRK